MAERDIKPEAGVTGPKCSCFCDCHEYEGIVHGCAHVVTSLGSACDECLTCCWGHHAESDGGPCARLCGICGEALCECCCGDREAAGSLAGVADVVAVNAFGAEVSGSAESPSEVRTVISKCCECPYFREYHDPEIEADCTGLAGGMSLSVNPVEAMDPDCPKQGDTMVWERPGSESFDDEFEAQSEAIQQTRLRQRNTLDFAELDLRDDTVTIAVSAAVVCAACNALRDSVEKFHPESDIAREAHAYASQLHDALRHAKPAMCERGSCGHPNEHALLSGLCGADGCPCGESNARDERVVSALAGGGWEISPGERASRGLPTKRSNDG